MSENSNHVDAYSPREIATRVEQQGVVKARTDPLTLLLLSTLAGAFISLGAAFFVVVVTDSELGFGFTRLVGGLCFSVGLILVVVAGAELFTGNNLIAMAWASRRITTAELLRNWLVVYTGNVLGCLATVGTLLAARIDQLGGGRIGEMAVQIAESKASLGILEALARGILCNALVCLAVWLAMGGRTVTDKILAIVFPISAFVAIGLEHSIANWFFLPWGWALVEPGAAPTGGMIQNLVFVSLGNVIGGTILVAGVYWLAYLRNRQIYD